MKPPITPLFLQNDKVIAYYANYDGVWHDILSVINSVTLFDVVNYSVSLGALFEPLNIDNSSASGTSLLKVVLTYHF